MGERIVGGERGERHGRSDGLVELAGVAQDADEAVMRFDEAQSVGLPAGCDGGAKSPGGFGGRVCGEQVEAAIAEGFGGGWIRIGHGSH